jgi:hypothetical protein
MTWGSHIRVTPSARCSKSNQREAIFKGIVRKA